MTKNTPILLPLLVVFAIQVTACGRGDAPDDSSDGQGISVRGAEGFSTQCPSGTIEPVIPVTDMALYDCPIGVGSVELAEPLEPIYLQADCHKKTITARTLDKQIETAWETMPNNTFFFSLGLEADGQDNRVRATLRSDGNGGHSDCTAPLTVVFDGSMDCTNPDKPVIHFETTMWPHLIPRTTNSSRPVAITTPGPTPTGPAHPSSTPNPTSTTIVSHPTSTPIPIPFPIPTTTIEPGPEPTHHTHHHLFNVSSEASVDSLNRNECSLPKTCYIYTKQMNLTQCP